MRWPIRLALPLLLLPCSWAVAQERQLHIERFDAELLVMRSGVTRVTENITARFEGQWNGLYRTIPINYRTSQNLNYRLRLELESATDGAGGPALRVEDKTENGNRVLKIWVPNARDVTRTIVLRYRVPNALRFFEEHDELYWNVTGDQWDVPIQAASARIVLPAESQGIRATAFTGIFGSRASNADIAVNGNGVAISARGPLAFHEGITAVVGWNPGVVQRPSALDRAGATLLANLVLVLPILVLLGMFRLWYRYGRDPRRLAVATAYEPPTDLRPAEVGTLVDNSPDIRDITATMVDLAVRGYLRIEETVDEKLFGLFSSKEYVFHLVRDRADWQELRSHEQHVLTGIFKGGASRVEASDLKNRFYQDIPAIKSAIFEHLVQRGHYRKRPDHVRSHWVAGALLLGIASTALGVVINQRAGADPSWAMMAGIVSTAVMMGFAFLMPARTVRGARTLEQALGFEEFLRRVESDRFERVIKTPELFEKYLPFALALSVDNNWCRAFQDIYTTPPQWYSGSSADRFSLHSFHGSLSRMTAATSQAMVAAPRSSSSGSSGFSGGGSSGGGFGGGGGGGF